MPRTQTPETTVLTPEMEAWVDRQVAAAPPMPAERREALQAHMGRILAE